MIKRVTECIETRDLIFFICEGRFSGTTLLLSLLELNCKTYFYRISNEWTKIEIQ